MSDKTKRWIKAAGMRAAKTMAQTAVANVAGGGYDHGSGLADRGWYGGAGRRGVCPDILGRSAGAGMA